MHQFLARYDEEHMELYLSHRLFFFSEAANSRLSIGQDSVGHSDSNKNLTKES